MDRLNSLMRGSMMGGSSAPPGAVSEPEYEGFIEDYAANIRLAHRVLKTTC